MAAVVGAACVAAGCAAAGRPLSPYEATAPAALMDAMRADAAARAAVDVSTVRVVGVAAVTWRDGSLGCPRPGMAYPQALVPGWRVWLAAGAQTLRYHAGQRGQWTWCPDDRSQEPLPNDPAI
jgi:hypothetical protein